ncbi:Major sperm protein [Aphelenchoides besseyi]|nr:Major sperm protein [Aphelenchoides besseyi]
MFDLEVVQLLGTAIVGFTTAALIQCASKKRDAKRGSLSKKSKGSVKSKKLGKSGKSAKSSKKSVKGSKKSLKGSKKSARNSKKSARVQPLVASTKKSKSSRQEPLPKVSVKVTTAQPADGSAKSSKQSTATARPTSDVAWVKPASRKSTRDSAQLPLAREKDESSLKVQATQPASNRREAADQKGEGTDLHMQPEQLRFSTEGGLLHCVIHNPSGDRQAVKVKCSDNKLYKVNPVYAFVEPNSTLRVDVCRVEGGKAKADKLIFVTAQAPSDEKEPKKLFNQKNRAEKEHMTVLPLIV